MKARTASCPINQFQCSDKTCIGFISLCDGHNDCSDAGDESECDCHNVDEECNALPQLQKLSCLKLYFTIHRKQCLPFTYVCDGIAHYRNGEDELCSVQMALNIHHKWEKPFQCHSGKTIPQKYVNDLIPDCEYSEDESNYHKLIIDEKYRTNRCESADMHSSQSAT